MKKQIIALALGLLSCLAPAVAAAPKVDITPRPKSMTVSEGSLTLPAALTISSTGLDAAMTAEVNKFASALTATTGISTTSGPALISVAVNSKVAPEGYNLKITTDGVSIEASAPAGLFYAFQTLKKVMPHNVMAGIKEEGSYSLPLINVKDEPQYGFRGMEIDVARHFFDLDQMKKMLRVMAAYKLNRLHWHLTDDQGWRLDVPGYPKLITEAAAPKDNYWCEFDTKTPGMYGKVYGPFYYTTDELKELVAYAKELHIEILPEVDLPGHMQCAIAAYPEFSTVPDADHQVRFHPGVSSDILDVSKPAVIQFLKAVLDQLIEVFPYEYIHIGGDECPKTYWDNSPDVQAFMAEKGITTGNALQNWLVKELADYVKPQGKKLVAWDEVICEEGADLEMAKEADILVYDWHDRQRSPKPSEQAAKLGLKVVWCSTNDYYIDYPQWGGSDEIKGMGYPITMESMYGANPWYDEAYKDLLLGVQCNLWTEYVCEPRHLEYMALPRMLVCAETGWTPRGSKNWEDFLGRFRRTESKYFDKANYTYGKHYLQETYVAPEADKWYRLITTSTSQNRTNRCIELVAEGSSLISEFGAKPNQLWTNTQAAAVATNYDNQYWRFEIDPDGSGKYAMICRAMPNGSVNPRYVAGSNENTTARWKYDADKRNYNFILTDVFQSNNGQYNHSVRSEFGENKYLSAATSGDNLAVNTWHLPLDGNGGVWLFSADGFVAPAPVTYPFTALENGKQYVIGNASAENTPYIQVEDGNLTATQPSNLCWSNRIWEVSDANYDAATNVQTLKLRNTATGLWIGAAGNVESQSGIGGDGYSGDLGGKIALTDDAAQAATLTIKANAQGELEIRIGDKKLFPLHPDNTWMPNQVRAKANATRFCGGTWTITEATPRTYVITDGTDTETRTVEASENLTSPRENFRIKSVEEKNGQWIITLERENWNVSYNLSDSTGTSWGVVKVLAPAGVAFTPTVPAVEYLKDGKIEGATDAVVPSADLTYNVTYATTLAHYGVLNPNNELAELPINTPILIEDAHADRHAFRNGSAAGVSGARQANNVSPAYTWIVEPGEKDRQYYIKNVGTDQYVQKVVRSQKATLGSTPAPFRFTYSKSKKTWTIKNASTDALCWDGLEDLSLVGWDAPGHPIKLYDFAAAPYYKVTIEERNQEGGLISSKSVYVKPGGSYMFAAESRKGKALLSVTGNEGLGDIHENKLITVTYTMDLGGVDQIATDGQSRPGAIYDLQGHRLNSVSRPGIYIINGRTVRVK